MVTYAGKCMKCQKEMVVTVGQIVQLDDIYWFRSWRCSHCGTSIEEDGQGYNQEISQLIIKSEGMWGLFLDGLGLSATTLKALRECLSFSMDEILTVKNNPSKAVYTGTEKEVLFYENNLKDRQVQVRHKKI